MRRAVALVVGATATTPAFAQAPPPPAYGGYPYAYGPPAEEAPREPVHRAPRNALWVGARIGYEAPLGDAYVDKDSRLGVSERDLVGAGPTLEADVGGRFGRGFLPFLFAAHTFCAKGAGPGVRSSTANAFGFGLRYAFAPDGYGFLAELAFSYRATATTLDSGTVIHAAAPGELRLGIGGDIRLTELFSLSPLVTIAIGSYSDVTATAPGDHPKNLVGGVGSHGYVGGALGGHFDLFGRP